MSNWLEKWKQINHFKLDSGKLLVCNSMLFILERNIYNFMDKLCVSDERLALLNEFLEDWCPFWGLNMSTIFVVLHGATILLLLSSYTLQNNKLLGCFKSKWLASYKFHQLLSSSYEKNDKIWRVHCICITETIPRPISWTIFLLQFKFNGKFHFPLIHILIKWLLQNFVHAMTAMLSWHVQKFVAI